MPGPVEEKPFELAVQAEMLSHRQFLLRYADGGAAVLHLNGDADRVEEVVRLINASVASRVDDPATARPVPPKTGNGVNPPKADPAAMTAWDHYAIAALHEAVEMSKPHIQLAWVANVCVEFADLMMARRPKAVRS